MRSGFLAVYLAGIIIGNRPTRAHNSVVTFLDAATWLAQIVMFVLLGLLVSPQRLGVSVGPAVLVALVLMLVARPVAVFICLAPFRFNWREKIFIAWTGLRGAVAIFLASIPMLVGLSKAYLYFDVAFVVVIISLLLQGWTLAVAARRLHVALPRADRGPRRVELDLPGQLEQELVGYPGPAEEPVFPARPDPVLVEADAGDPQRDTFSRPRRPSRSRPATTSICWRRRKRPRRWIASSSTCRRAPRPIRICSATSWSPARSRSRDLAAGLRHRGRRGGLQADARGLFRRPSRPCAEGRRDLGARLHRAGRAQHLGRPGQRRRPSPARRGRRSACHRRGWNRSSASSASSGPRSRGSEPRWPLLWNGWTLPSLAETAAHNCCWERRRTRPYAGLDR